VSLTACPVFGKIGQSCIGATPVDYSKVMEDHDMAGQQSENESGTIRMPQQFVREGRGVAGYRSAHGVKVETYDPKKGSDPKHVKRVSGETKSK